MSSSEKNGRLLIFDKPAADCGTKTDKVTTSGDSEQVVADLSSIRKERKRKVRQEEKSLGLKNVSDDLHELIMTHVKDGSFQAHELAALLTHYARDLVFLSFEGMEPEAKRVQRENLRQYLAKDVMMKPATSYRQKD